jgi:hypothetical protein
VDRPTYQLKNGIEIDGYSLFSMTDALSMPKIHMSASLYKREGRICNSKQYQK